MSYKSMAAEGASIIRATATEMGYAHGKGYSDKKWLENGAAGFNRYVSVEVFGFGAARQQVDDTGEAEREEIAEFLKKVNERFITMRIIKNKGDFSVAWYSGRRIRFTTMNEV